MSQKIKNIIPLVLSLIFLSQSSLFSQEITRQERKLLRSEKRQAERDCHESPYRFNWKHETAIASASLVYFVGGGVLDITRKSLTEAQVGSLNPNDVNKFDRFAIGNKDPNGALISDIVLGTSFVLPATVLAVRGCRQDVLVIGLMWFEVAALTLGTTEYVKSLVLRTRPLAYDPSVSLSVKMQRDTRMSFFSGHTATVAAFSFFGAKVFSDYSDNISHKAIVWSGAILLPLVTGYLRFRSGKHFPTDTIAGYAIGASIGYLVPFLHKRKPIVKGMSIMPYSGGTKDMGLYMSYQF